MAAKFGKQIRGVFKEPPSGKKTMCHFCSKPPTHAYHGTPLCGECYGVQMLQYLTEWEGLSVSEALSEIKRERHRKCT